MNSEIQAERTETVGENKWEDVAMVGSESQ